MKTLLFRAGKPVVQITVIETATDHLLDIDPDKGLSVPSAALPVNCFMAGTADPLILQKSFHTRHERYVQVVPYLRAGQVVHGVSYSFLLKHPRLHPPSIQ